MRGCDVGKRRAQLGAQGSASLKYASLVGLHTPGLYAGRGVHVFRSVDDMTGRNAPPVLVPYA